MPIEIRELVIKATVSEASAATSNHEGGVGSGNGADGEAMVEAIVQACVRQVLAILARDAER